MSETKVPDYTETNGTSDEMVAETSLLNDFEFTDSIAVDQQFEDIPARKVLAADGNTGGDIFGRVETSRSNDQEGYYRIVLPFKTSTGEYYIAFEIVRTLGGAGGDIVGASLLNFSISPGAAPGGDTLFSVPGYISPVDDSSYDIGSSALRWANIYADNIDATSMTFTDLSVTKLNVGVTSPAALGADFTLTPSGSYMILSAAAARTSSVTTAVSNGNAGQMLILQGTDDTNTITIKDGANTQMAGDCVLGANDTLTLFFNGTDWIETARANN